MDASAKETYTISDIEALPEGHRAELIDGRWYDMSAPSLTHQKIVMAIAGELRSHIRNKGGSCQVIPAPFAVYLNADNMNYVEPDISVVCDTDKLDEKGCHGAPDLTVEVVSDSSKKLDYGAKLFKYRTEGVKEYWIINPEHKTINTYVFSDNDEEIADQINFGEELRSSLFQGFAIVLNEII